MKIKKYQSIKKMYIVELYKFQDETKNQEPACKSNVSNIFLN